jgi:uncharacterized membrane protein
MSCMVNQKLYTYIQGESKMRVLILTRSRACQMKRFFYLNVLQKELQIDSKFKNVYPSMGKGENFLL